MVVDGGVSDLQQWKRQLLEHVVLPAPDGRPLYAYRLSEDQFQSLEDTLKNQLQRFSSVGVLANSNLSFGALFVLYAAEWWRRRYDGSRWSWEPILADLTSCSSDWSAIQRGECVNQGLRYWKLSAGDTGGLRYLGAIAVQGGLPMQLLAEARGNLGRMLLKVLKLAVGGAEFRQIRGWIESLADDLPKSYRREEIYVLLAEVIDTVLRLKNEARLTVSSEAISQLDQQAPGWRTRFPLPIEDENIQGLIEQLIRDVTECRNTRSNSNIVVQRWLNNGDDDIWPLRACVEMPDVLNESDIRGLFSIRDEFSLPRNFELILNAENSQQTYAARKIAGHDAYRLERSPKELRGMAAAAEHRMSLRCTDGQSWHTTLRNGESLDSDLPWLFECSAEQLPRMIRQGGGDVAPAELIVAIPSGATIVQSDNGRSEMVAFLEEPEREVYSIEGAVIVKDCTGRKSTIRTGRADASEESYQWHGDRLWLDFIKPNVAFRDKPHLSILYGDEGIQHIHDREVSWSHRSDTYGPAKAWYEQKGELRHQTKMVLLPRDASVEYQPKSASNGIIRLHHWKLAGVSLVDESVADIQIQHDGTTLSLTCSSKQAVAPEWLDLTLAWEGNTNTARIRLPFPAEGARAFDGTGHELCSDSWLSVQHLAGVRLISFCRSHIPVEIVFRLRHTKQRENEHELRRRIRPIVGTSRLEIRLVDYADDIQQLLAADELLDAWVEVGLHVNNQPALTVRVSRYTCRLGRLTSDILITDEHLKGVTPEQLESLPVLALRLECPAEEPIRISCVKSQGIANGAWRFDPNSREPGAWLIYPGKASSLVFRPTLWLVTGDSKANTPLANALAIESREERAVGMDQAIAAMAQDFCHPSWQDLEHLTERLGHLPLATLDVWRRFAHAPSGMAALALRMGSLPEGFLQRFALEQPFAWELVPIQAWLNASKQLEQQAVSWFGNESGQRQFGEYLNNRTTEISAFCPALGKLLGIVKSIALKDNCKEVSMMRKLDSNDIFREQLFDGEDSALRRLFRDHSDDKWPSDSKIFDAIKNIRKRMEFSQFFIKESYNFKDTVIGLPILSALQVATSSTGDWFDHPELIHALRTYMGFDHEWFIEAFDLTIARCLSTDVMKI